VKSKIHQLSYIHGANNIKTTVQELLLGKNVDPLGGMK
jgi:hypothetical protein